MDSRIFRIAAECLANEECSHEPPETINCPLRAITCTDKTSADAWVEYNLARAFFTRLFRPDGIDPYEHWWDESDYDATIISLLLAELVSEHANDFLIDFL